MGVSDLKFDKNAGPVIDLSSQGLQKVEPNFTCTEDTHTLILDHNHIMKLDHLERSPSLQQLSVASNRLVRMMGVCRLKELRVLNLPSNSIGYIEGLRDLPHLEWLNLSGNNIKVIEQLNNCKSLQHLDLSENNISNIGDLSKLLALKTVLLHGNSITTLCTVPSHLPAHLSILSLAENEIRDLNEVSYLASLHELEQLSIMDNPCVMATPSLPGFDYRPYIMSWCLNLKVLDGYVVSQKEALKAEWLYSQGKSRSYRLGQHVQLVQYLTSVCSLSSISALETEEDAKLEKILSKQRFHQRQLLQQIQVASPSPPRPTQLDVETHSPQHSILPGGSAREVTNATPPVPASVPSDRETDTEPMVQFNNWVTPDPSHPSGPVIRNSRVVGEPVYLKDEDRLNGSLLSSESTFLPVTSDQEPQLSHSDSEDETYTFDPDSLAPEHPALTHYPPSKKELNVYKEAGYHSSPTAGSSGARGDPPQETPSDGGKMQVQSGPNQSGPVTCANKAFSAEKYRAAVKIQSWWRGMYTRHCHTVAKEIRNEIRLRRMQEHILFLSGELQRVQKQYEEDQLQRLVQEEAVRFLWKQVQSMQHWKQSVEQQLASIKQAVIPGQGSASVICGPALPVSSSTADPASTGISFPDSGFQTTSEQQAEQEDSFLSSGTVDSLETVRALTLGSPACGGGNNSDSPDCSLLEQYLSSIQQREEEANEGTAGDRTETPLAPSPLSPNSPSQYKMKRPSNSAAHSQPASPI